MKLLFDKNSNLNLKLDSTTGFLTAPVTLARTGVQYYMGIELGLEDRAIEKIGIVRPSSEVFDKKSMESFVNLVVTDDHPNKPVTSDNVKQLQVGSVSQIENDTTTLKGIITITDKAMIEKIKSGKVQVSVGYQNDLKKESGHFGGEEYEFVQTNIKANHLAIVDVGRCGPDCKLTTDKKGVKTVKVTIHGITFDTENEALVQAVNKLVATHDEETKNLKEQFKKKEEEDEEEKKKMKKEKESADAKADILEKSKLSDADISVLVTERAELLADARAILGDKMPKCVDCPKEIKTLVVDHLLPDLKVSDQTDDYLNASYDIAVAKFKKAEKNGDKLKNDFKQDKEVETTRQTARDKYMKDAGFVIG